MNKMRVVIALEYRDGKVGRGYAKVIKDYSSKSLGEIFEMHISKDTTDGWWKLHTTYERISSF